jgi:hypothetical protein
LTIARAARPVKMFVITVWSSRAFFKAPRYNGATIRFGTKKIGRSHLHPRSAEREGGGDAAPVGDTTCRNNRQVHSVDQLGNEGHGANLRRNSV